jgi:hypothetical protein
MGVLYVCGWSGYFSPLASYDYFLSYHSISLSLNVILTLMIIARLLLHWRNIRNALGNSAEFGGSYNAVITMLVESYSPYAISYTLYLALYIAGSSSSFVFSKIFGGTQVCPIFASSQRGGMLLADRDSCRSSPRSW